MHERRRALLGAGRAVDPAGGLTAELGQRRRTGRRAQRAARAVLVAHPDDREVAENDLTRTLRALSVASLPGATNWMTEVTEASRRLALARQVHSDPRS